MIKQKHTRLFLLLLTTLITSCVTEKKPDLMAFVGATIITGIDESPIANGTILVKNGKIIEVGTVASVEIPEETKLFNIEGKTVIPGLINTHGHVGALKGLSYDNYSRQNILDQLNLYARYGITAVVSLGDDQSEAAKIKEEQDTSNLTRARLYYAGSVVGGNSTKEALKMIEENLVIDVDYIKIRVDDNLGSGSKMSKQVYQAVINKSHEIGLPVAAHMFYLDDAKQLLRSGADFLAHSIRDTLVDDEVMGLLKEQRVCYCPTLTRDLSTFIYETTPDFFNDPFFTKEVDPLVLAQLQDPTYQQKIKERKSAQAYKLAFEVAKKNVKILSENDIPIAFGTDSGMPARFQGYFEHLEMDIMAESSLSPLQIIKSATSDAAKCMKLKDIGSLEVGKWADFIVLNANPLTDIKNIHNIASVWIAGNKVRDK